MGFISRSNLHNVFLFHGFRSKWGYTLQRLRMFLNPDVGFSPHSMVQGALVPLVSGGHTSERVVSCPRPYLVIFIGMFLVPG